VRGVQAGRFDVLGARAVLANLATVGALICLLGVTPKARADAAEPAVRAEVQAVVSRDLGRVSGRVRLTVQAPPGQALAHIDLWAFPERLATPPPEMDEVDEPRVFPVGFRPAGLTLDRAVDPLGNSLRVERIEGTVYRVWLATPAEAGTRAVVEVDFDTQVPRRFGPFGRDAGQLTLDGGWFPRPPPLGVDGFQSDLPPDEIDYSVRLQWQGERRSLAVVNGELADVPAGGDAVRVGSGVARRVALVLYTQHQISRLSTDYGRVMLIHRRQRRGMRGADGLADLAAIDVHAQTLGTVGAALGFLARQGLRARGVTVCAEAPLRRELARTAPGMLLVSDRAFDVTPFERVRKFHRLPLVRATAALVVEPRVAAAAPRGRADQVVDLVATELTEAWERDQYGTQEGARELLTKGNFVAEVDDALTAPQIPFESAFFRGPDDTDRFRDTFDLFSHRRPVGRLWLEKLVDRLGRDAAHAIARAVAEGESLPAALARLGDGVDLAWLAAWDQGTPERNFAVGEVTPGGDEAGPYVDVVVRTEGPASPPEHLIVRVEGGTDGPVEAPVLVDAERVTARVRTDARRPRVTLDPKRRLAESDLGRPVDPRADNLTHRGWRVLLDGLGLSLNSASGRADTVITGFVRREADIANSIFLAVFDLERRTGAAMDWVHGLGPKVAPNRRRFGVGVGGSVSWLKPRAGGGSGVGVRFRLGFSDLTFLSRTDPRSGVTRSLWGGPTLAVRDGTTDIGFSASGLLGRLVPVGDRHTLAGVLRADVLLGEISSSESLGIGGLGAVRALATFARAGELRLAGSLEWRHRLTRNVSLSALQLAFVHGVDGVLFVDAGLLARTPRGLVRAAAASLGVGYGFRFHYVIGGVTPMVFSIDGAVPLLVGGGLPRGVIPVTVIAGVGQSF
jgi:hypothetical protein